MDTWVYSENVWGLKKTQKVLLCAITMQRFETRRNKNQWGNVLTQGPDSQTLP